jgi:hypothetical protein
MDETKFRGELALRTLAMSADTNANGDIFGGWLVSQMDLAAGIVAKTYAKSRAATVRNASSPRNLVSSISKLSYPSIKSPNINTCCPIIYDTAK